jgi:hypothetical protein
MCYTLICENEENLGFGAFHMPVVEDESDV